MSLLLLPFVLQGALVWAGCGIAEKAFMAELAKADEKKTGIKLHLEGGGATKGIRKAVAGEIGGAWHERPAQLAY